MVCAYWSDFVPRCTFLWDFFRFWFRFCLARLHKSNRLAALTNNHHNFQFYSPFKLTFIHIYAERYCTMHTIYCQSYFQPLKYFFNLLNVAKTIPMWTNRHTHTYHSGREKGKHTEELCQFFRSFSHLWIFCGCTLRFLLHSHHWICHSIFRCCWCGCCSAASSFCPFD